MLRCEDSKPGLTDHDTVAGYETFNNNGEFLASRQNSLRVVRIFDWR